MQQSIDALGASNNVLFPPTVLVESGIVDCNHVNITSSERHVLTELIDANFGTVIATSGAAIPTAPGRHRGIGAFSPAAANGYVYCKFTVTDGTKADIRANLPLTPNTNSIETTAVSVTAQ